MFKTEISLSEELPKKLSGNHLEKQHRNIKIHCYTLPRDSLTSKVPCTLYLNYKPQRRI